MTVVTQAFMDRLESDPYGDCYVTVGMLLVGGKPQYRHPQVTAEVLLDVLVDHYGWGMVLQVLEGQGGPSPDPALSRYVRRLALEGRTRAGEPYPLATGNAWASYVGAMEAAHGLDFEEFPSDAERARLPADVQVCYRLWMSRLCWRLAEDADLTRLLLDWHSRYPFLAPYWLLRMVLEQDLEGRVRMMGITEAWGTEDQREALWSLVGQCEGSPDLA